MKWYSMNLNKCNKCMEEDTAKVYLADDVDKHIEKLEQAYTVLVLKISQYLNGNLSVSAEDIKKEWKRGEQLLKGQNDD